MRLRWAEQGAYGGASSVIALGHAADAIGAGPAPRNILILAGDVFSVSTHDAMLDSFTPRDPAITWGRTDSAAPTASFALVQSKHAKPVRHDQEAARQGRGHTARGTRC